MRTTGTNNAAGVTVDVGAASRHWLFGVAQRAGLENTDKLVLDRCVAIHDAWAEVCTVCCIGEKVLAQRIADHFRLDVADIMTAEAHAIKLVPENVAHQLQVYPLRENDRELVVATSDPTNLEAEETLEFTSGRKPIFEVASPTALKEAINAAYRPDSAVEKLSVGVDADVPATVDVVNSNVPEALAEQVTDDAADHRGITRILVVDDDAVNRTLARTILEKSGFAVWEARDGEAALEHLAGGVPFDLLVLDLNMPRLDGRGVLQRVRANVATAGLPVVILTGSGRDHAAVTMMEEGADDYICKPIDPLRFAARIMATLRRAET